MVISVTFKDESSTEMNNFQIWIKAFHKDRLEQAEWFRESWVNQENFLKPEKDLQPLKCYQMAYLLLIKALS